MVANHSNHSLRILRWSLACVLGGTAALLLHSLAAHGQIASALAAIAAAEVLGASLLFVPAAVGIATRLLLATLLAAALFHVLHRQVPPAAFLVYAAGLLVVAADARRVLPGGSR